jgi:hypothetical protein
VVPFFIARAPYPTAICVQECRIFMSEFQLARMAGFSGCGQAVRKVGLKAPSGAINIAAMVILVSGLFLRHNLSKEQVTAASLLNNSAFGVLSAAYSAEFSLAACLQAMRCGKGDGWKFLNRDGGLGPRQTVTSGGANVPRAGEAGFCCACYRGLLCGTKRLLLRDLELKRGHLSKAVLLFQLQ